MRPLAMLALLATPPGTSGCASVRSTAQGVPSGDLVGAGIGAAAVATTGGAVGTGALVGSLVGAAGGGYSGCHNSGHWR
jgi:osmotically inducible lipoprotein OsmB